MDGQNARRLTQQDAARLIGVSARTLQRWRERGMGPPFYALPGRIVYDPIEVKEWISSLRRLPLDGEISRHA